MITFLILLIFQAHDLPAWELVGPEGIGYGITSIVQSSTNPQELYCVGGCSAPGWSDYGNYIYHSDNEGTTWAPIQSPRERWFAGALLGHTFSGTLLMYNINGDGIFYSIDNGDYWSYENLPSNADNVARIVTLPTESERVWAVGDAQFKRNNDAIYAAVWISTNSGQSWSSNDILTTPAQAYDLAVSASDIQTLCVAGTSSSAAILMKTVNGANTWSSITPLECAGDVSGIGVAIHPSDKDVIVFSTEEGIYRSSNGGANWNSVSDFNDVSQISFSLSDPSIVVARAENKIVMSRNAGITWEIAHTLSSGEVVHQVLPSSTSGNQIFAATSTGCLISSDAGASWDLSNDGLCFSSTYSLTDAVEASSRMYMILDGEFSMSDDMGFSWTTRSTPAGTNPIFSDLCRNPFDQENVINIGMQGEIFVTQNSGATWITHSGMFSDVNCTLADPSEDGVFYVGGTSLNRTELMRIGRTEDSGATWSITDLGDSSASIYAACVDPSKPDTLYAAGNYYNPSGHMIMRSFDGGESWHELQTSIPATSGIRSISVSPFNSSLILVSTMTGIYRSDDFGLFWEKVTAASSSRFVKFDPYDPNRAWKWDEWYPVRGIGVSMDGGLTWEECNEGLPFWKSARRLSFVDPNFAYVSTSASLFRLELPTTAIGSQSIAITSPALTITPNPVVSTATVSFTSLAMCPVKFTLFDVTGRIVKEQTIIPAETGLNTFQWSTSGDLPSNGVYFLKLDDGESEDFTRMVICTE